MKTVGDIVEEKYIDRLPQLLLAAGLFAAATMLAVLVYLNRHTRPETGPVASTATVMLFEGGDCARCDDFRNKIAKPHARSALGAKIPVRYYDVSDGQPPKRFKLNGDVGPGTVVVLDVYNREAARINYVPRSLDAFQSMLEPHARRAEREISETHGRR